ncbi:segregation/condensation protein A [Ornithinimicrobium sp. Arc0846-15]|nr:segregation/condensation protein A [Ornithinimicrobium laminariae]
MLTNRSAATPFEVHLDAFSGPFELLLGLISKHKLDVTEIALAHITDEFVAHMRAAQARGDLWDLSQASEFVLIAATLLDIKASRLLPGSREEDEEDLALIEARDLLFARLLQYRAFKEVAGELDDRLTKHGRVWPRDVGIEERFAKLLPEVQLKVTAEQLAMIAAGAMLPKPEPVVGLEHLHTSTVSVREQTALVASRLQEHGASTFAELIADADSRLVVVARFLALLELFRESLVELDQADALGALTATWIGAAMDGSAVATHVGAEFDEGDADE